LRHAEVREGREVRFLDDMVPFALFAPSRETGDHSHTPSR